MPKRLFFNVNPWDTSVWPRHLFFFKEVPPFSQKQRKPKRTKAFTMAPLLTIMAPQHFKEVPPNPLPILKILVDKWKPMLYNILTNKNKGIISWFIHLEISMANSSSPASVSKKQWKKNLTNYLKPMLVQQLISTMKLSQNISKNIAIIKNTVVTYGYHYT